MNSEATIIHRQPFGPVYSTESDSVGRRVFAAFRSSSRVENASDSDAFDESCHRRSNTDGPTTISYDPAVLVTPFDDFTASLPPVFRLKARPTLGFLKYMFELDNPDDITICVGHLETSRGAWFPENRGRVLVVEDEDHMRRLMNTLFTRPILLVTRIYYKASSPTQRDFVVLVNTEHPSIRQPMERALLHALRDMSRGSAVSVEIDFSTIIEQWFSKVLTQSDNITSAACNSPSSTSGSNPSPQLSPTTSSSLPLTWTDLARRSSVASAGGSIVVTSTNEFERIFRCRDRIDVYFWILCLPCCLFSCPCYRIQRFLTVRDQRVVISADVTYLPLGRSFPSQLNAIRFLRNSLVTGAYMTADQIVPRMFAMQREREQQHEARERNERDDVQPPTSDPRRGMVVTYTEESPPYPGKDDFANTHDHGEATDNQADNVLPSYEEVVQMIPDTQLLL